MRLKKAAVMGTEIHKFVQIKNGIEGDEKRGSRSKYC